MSKQMIRTLTLCLLLVATFGAWHSVSHAQPTEPPPLPTYKTDWRITTVDAPIAAADADDGLSAAAIDQSSGNWWSYAFEQQRDDSSEIFVRERVNRNDGSSDNTTHRLTDHPAADFQPRLNFDATAVLFVSEREGNAELYKINVDGSNLTRLTNNGALDFMPTWSADDSQVAFISDRSGSAQVYTMSASGQNVRAITNAHNNIWVDWSSAGDRLAWIQIRGEERFLLVANADGSEQRTIAGPLAFAQHPRWSPDGGRIALDYDTNDDFSNDIVVLNADRSGINVLTTGSFDGFTFNDLWLNSWLPNGETLVYRRYSYRVNDGQLIPSSTELRRVSEGQDDSFRGLPTATFDVDVRNADPYAPSSTLRGLSPYTRIFGPSLTWLGMDRGPSGIERYEVESKRGSGNWQTEASVEPGDVLDEDLRAVTYDGLRSVSLAEPMTGQVAFRTHSTDRAGNVEEWPEVPDASTTFFAWQLLGQLTDNRGRPLAARPIANSGALNTPQTNSDGTFQLFTENDAQIELDGDTFTIDEDTYINRYQPSPESIALFGDSIAESTTRLRADCVGLCLHQPQAVQCQEGTGDCLPDGQIISEAWETNYELVADPNGTLHLFTIAPSALQHQFFKEDRTWSEPIHLGRLGLAYTPISTAFDLQGNLHVVWTGGNGGVATTQHRRRTREGAWESATNVHPGRNAEMAVNNRGHLHVVYTYTSRQDFENNGIYYATQVPGEQWQSPVKLASILSDYRPKYQMAVTNDNTLHIIFDDGAADFSSSVDQRSIIYRTRTPSGRLSQPETLTVSGDFHTPQLFADGNLLHLFWTSIFRQGNTYATLIQQTRSPTSGWLPRRIFDSRYYGNSLTVAQTGKSLHTFAYSENGNATLPLLNLQQTAAGSWYPPRTFDAPLEGAGVESLALDAQGNLAVITKTDTGFDTPPRYTFYASQVITQAETIEESINLTVPADMHEPTFSFLHTLRGASGSDTTANITIDDGVASTQVFTATDDSSGALGWADLSPWSGQSVTATVSLNQAAGSPPASVTLEQVTLGSWRTAVVDGVEPQNVEVGGATLTLRGQNFLAGLQLSIRDVTTGAERALGARLVDGQTLEADVPAGLAPGLYQVSVTNSGGEEFVAAEPLQIGERVLLPIIGR